jgi:hypothetical protein
VNQPGQDIKVLSERDPVEHEGLVQVLSHDALLQHAACLLVHQVPTVGVDGETQESHRVLVGVEENVRMWAVEGKQFIYFGKIRLLKLQENSKTL